MRPSWRQSSILQTVQSRCSCARQCFRVVVRVHGVQPASSTATRNGAQTNRRRPQRRQSRCHDKAKPKTDNSSTAHAHARCSSTYRSCNDESQTGQARAEPTPKHLRAQSAQNACEHDVTYTLRCTGDQHRLQQNRDILGQSFWVCDLRAVVALQTSTGHASDDRRRF